MAQLVGTSCVHCAARISNELDAEFCSTCGQPCHIACCRPPEPLEADVCDSCGARFVATAKARRVAQQEEAERAAPRPLNLVEKIPEAVRLYRFIKCVVMGLPFIAIGVLLLASSDLRDNPGSVSIGDAARALGVAAVGIVILLFGWWGYRDAKRSAKQRQFR